MRVLEFANDSCQRLKVAPTDDGGAIVTIYNTWHDGSLSFTLTPAQTRSLSEWLVER